MLRIALLACLAFLGCSPGRQDVERELLLVPAGASFEVPAEAGAALVVRVEVAATEESRMRGLMHRESLPPDSGMLFVYPDEAVREFWMKNTSIPLSIAFLDAAGGILRIIDMEPGVGVPDRLLPRYLSVDPARYALEMEKGWFRAHGIAAGDAMILHDTILALRAD